MDDELTPQQEERVRRLLARARHTEPMPDDVAARLDRVIADLAEEPDGRAGSTPVVRLAERRRRAGRLLLAAAVVVVGGVAVGQVVGDSPMGADSESGANDAAVSQESQGRPAPDRDSGSDTLDSEPEAEAEAEGGAGPGVMSESTRTLAPIAPQPVRADRFSADAQRLRDATTARRPARERLARQPDRGSASADYVRCAPGDWGGGRYVRVTYERDSGWLVLHPPRGDTQVAELFLCGADAAERSATLPFP